MFRMRSWSSAFSSTALKWKGIKFKIAFPSILWAGFGWDPQPVRGVRLLRLNRQRWSVQQLPLDGHHPGLASPGGRDDPRHLAARSSLQPGCPWHLLIAYISSTCIFEANILLILTFINKFQEGSQCLNSTALGVTISSSFGSHPLLQQSPRHGSCEYTSQCKSDVS